MLKQTYDQKRRSRLLAEGLCTRCGKNQLKPNTRVCDTCISQTTENYRNRRHLPEVKDRTRKWAKKYRDAIRYEVFAAYGNRCTCCQETEHLFLELDHINNDGYLKRREITGTKSGGVAIYRWAKNHNYPKDLQLLCSNCNQGKRRNGGICPHKISI